MIASLQPATRKIREIFDNLADWQTSVISLILHLIIILLLGGTVLYQAVKEPSDFTADGGFFGDGNDAEAAAGPTDLPPGPPAMPEIILPSPKETVSAISTTSTVAPTFVVPISTSAVSNMATQMMADAATSAQSSAKSLAGSMGGGGGGGGTGTWGKSRGKGTWGKGFGSMEKDDMMLVGTFYDLKRPRDPKGFPPDPTGDIKSHQSPYNLSNILGQIVESKFSPEALRDFFRSDKPIYNSHFFIPLTPSTEGPAAFGLKDVEPKKWIIHYTGGISPPKSGKYRFWGMGDDILIVAIDKKVVMDASRAPYRGKFQPAEPFPFTGQINDKLKLIRPGDWINLSDQQTYKIDVVIGEDPGGSFASLLMVEEEGKTYEKNSNGAPIVSLFSTLPISISEMPKMENAPPVDREAVIMTPKKNVMSGGTSNETL